MDKRHQRMLEEVIKLPGNETCADCRAPAPRWASVNLGIFLCVTCASVHRKMGTHKSRVKSVTLDDWTREQIVHMRSIGNTAANAVWNPNESAFPRPSTTGAEERDSELEKYIRRKYEQAAFRKGNANGGGGAAAAPTSLNRARERDGRLPMGSASSTSGSGSTSSGPGSVNRLASGSSLGSGSTASTWTGGTNGNGTVNRSNPELNDVLVRKEVRVERELPALPISASSTGVAPRVRPTSSRGSTPNPSSANDSTLIDLSGGTSSTLPLQINVNGHAHTAHAGYNVIPSSFGTTPTPQPLSQSQGLHSLAYSAPPTSMSMSMSTTANSPGYNPFLQQQPQTAFATGSFNPNSDPNSNSLSPFQQPNMAAFQSSFQQQLQIQQQQQQQQQQQAYSPFQHPHQTSANPMGQFQTQSQNSFGMGMPQVQVQSPWGQSAGAMGMQHANGSGGGGYFAQNQNQGQSQMQSQVQPQGMQWAGSGMNMGSGIGLGMGMNMGMAGMTGQGGYMR
ncbi:hypothetical protein JCM24511_06042 [Saitozyma sp. JCM 24511]|nr:hypothetical protein JCM24511_06042 [Saitozyma sp. JCM 24511]